MSNISTVFYSASVFVADILTEVSLTSAETAKLTFFLYPVVVDLAYSHVDEPTLVKREYLLNTNNCAARNSLVSLKYGVGNNAYSIYIQGIEEG